MTTTSLAWMRRWACSTGAPRCVERESVRAQSSHRERGPFGHTLHALTLSRSTSERPRARLAHLGGHVVGVLGEVAVELHGQLARLAIVLLGVLPGRARLQDLVRH